ncbi:MAG: hypothetical protein AB8G11_07250 [Saprospiraceae bacterium]
MKTFTKLNIILLLTVPNLLFFTCGDEGFIDTTTYHEQTLRLSENMIVLDSFHRIIGSESCDELLNVDSIFMKYDYLCQTIEKYNLDLGTLITVDNCVIKKEKIKLKSLAQTYWFKEELEQIDSILQELDATVETMIKQVEKNCIQKYQVCQDIINNPFNKEVLRSTKALLSVRNQSEAQILSDSLKIKSQLKDYEAILRGGQNSMYKYLLLSLIEDTKFILSHKKNKQYCNNAHIRWAALEEAYVSKTNPCELRYLYDLSSEKWDVTIDSQWVLTQTNLSRDCAIYVRGCTCENAKNYDSLAVVDNGTCVGCMDSLALNYCSNANRQGNVACEYRLCDDNCYEEKPKNITSVYSNFKAGRDIIVHDATLCKTNWCGCMNPCADNYDLTAKVDDGSCVGTICGCLDSTAVNYAKRADIAWAIEKYQNLDIVKNDSTLCHWKGCTSPCALNYDPRAKINDGSCICDSTSRISLEKIITQVKLETAGQVSSPTILAEEFKTYINKDMERYANIDFKRVGMDLIIDVDFKKMKIESSSELDGIPLGSYHFRPVDELIDALISFLNFKSRNLTGSMLTATIIGEADGHPIRGSGLPFQNAGRAIVEEPFYNFNANENTSITAINNGLDMTPNHAAISLQENEVFNDNITLAFLRAYMVKQQIKDLEPSVEESRIMIGAKANTAKGKEYRRIGISFKLDGFYEVTAEFVEAETEVRENVEAAIEFYEKEGYPTPNKVYSECPCY